MITRITLNNSALNNTIDEGTAKSFSIVRSILKFALNSRALLLLSCYLILAPLQVSYAQDDRYIADVFYVPLHSGNSTKHRIIHRGLKTGTRLILLETDESAGFSRVKTVKGTEGWIQNQFLSTTPIARTQLAKLQQQYGKLQQQQVKLKDTNSQTRQSNSEIQNQVKLLSRENQNLTGELASIKKVSANAINLDSSNRDLLKRNEMLKIEIAELHADNTRLADKSDKEWFVRGALAVAIGALLTVLLPKLKPKPRSREWG